VASTGHDDGKDRERDDQFQQYICAARGPMGSYAHFGLRVWRDRSPTSSPVSTSKPASNSTAAVRKTDARRIRHASRLKDPTPHFSRLDHVPFAIAPHQYSHCIPSSRGLSPSRAAPNAARPRAVPLVSTGPTLLVGSRTTSVALHTTRARRSRVEAACATPRGTSRTRRESRMGTVCGWHECLRAR
jgi:hypothetical protein